MSEYRHYLLGVGNVMMGDDGIGPAIIEHLADREDELGFGLIDIGGDSLKVLNYLEDTIERLLIIDTAYMGLTPGEYRLFKPDEVNSHKTLNGFSTHSGDLLGVIETGRKLGFTIPDICILGVQPESLSQGMKLSAALQNRLTEYAYIAVAQLNELQLSH